MARRSGADLLVDKFRSSPNAIWRIAANPCAVPFFVFVEAMLPSLLFLASRVLIPDFEDLATDATRSVYNQGWTRKHRHRRRATARTGVPKAGDAPTRNGLLPPNIRSGLRRAIWFPIAATEVAGYTYLLVNLMNDAAFAWTSLQQFCPECTGVQTPVAFGPLIRSNDFYAKPIYESWDAVFADTVLQNRANWVNNSAGCTVPGGSYWGSCFAKFRLITNGPLDLEMRTIVTYHYLGLDIDIVRDVERVTLKTDQDIGCGTNCDFEVPIGLSASIRFEVHTLNPALPLIEVRDTYLIVSGRSVCSS